MARTILFVTGWDPVEGTGGHSAYVRAHARAARALGFDVQIFCAGESSATVATEYGTVRRTPPRWKLPGFTFRKQARVWQAQPIAAAAAHFGLSQSGPALIHGFGVWGCAAVAAK